MATAKKKVTKAKTKPKKKSPVRKRRLKKKEARSFCRPKAFSNPEEMDLWIEDYFLTITREIPKTEPKKTGKLIKVGAKVIEEIIEETVINAKGEQVIIIEFLVTPTVAGLCNHLGICRETLRKYAGDEAYTDTIKKAKSYLEAHLEKGLYGNSVTGLIFNLKNNFGWQDKTEQVISSTVTLMGRCKVNGTLLTFDVGEELKDAEAKSSAGYTD